ncbi:MAG: hypothetical protein JNM58_04185 [Xanthomonadaceae bacterium]|nr:hypothetical protein [Xanthomonadaceae bacterium]
MAYRPNAFSGELKLASWLLLCGMAVVGLVLSIQQHGISPLSIIAGIVVVSAIAGIFTTYRRSNHRLTQALRALANLDASMRFPRDAPLQREFDRVRERILRSQSEARTQSRFLKSMLVHLDAGILVLNGAGCVVHKNPAADRLLGPLPDDTSDASWRSLGDLLGRATSPARAIIPWKKGEHEDTLSVYVSFFRDDTDRTRIVSIQSIRQALEAKEQSAYKQLTRVLTHEVANSIMPLVSLANTASNLIDSDHDIAKAQAHDDLKEALQVISNRAEHLGQFVARFAEISRLPPPSLQRVDLRSLVSNVVVLFDDTFRKQGIKVRIDIQSESEFWVMADPVQIEQVVVNLVVNAVEAMKTTPDRTLLIGISGNAYDQTTVDIRDSGPGIEPHVRHQVFVPFFTTKPKGSGIGLSLARQIMVGHGGDLLLVSPDGDAGSSRGAHFRVLFS